MLNTLAKQSGLPGAAPLAGRQGQLDTALGEVGARAPIVQGQMTPEQKSDWQAVGTGQMKLGQFRAKYGFLPN